MDFWQQADIDALKSAIASGVLSVTYAGPPSRTVVYQSLASMRALLAAMRVDVEGTPRRRLASVRKGFPRGS